MYADISFGLFKIKKGVIVYLKPMCGSDPQQLILCINFDKKSSELIVNKKCTNEGIDCQKNNKIACIFGAV